ncbi:hydroxyethylthiazole kinase [Actinocatenispora thailandica]|uniref:Hydroxyethylthiazole kinase n=1 Tax=Actinocatenispora thailandica TaxID=227318 RepID=A0A7R7DPU5_9ACTN|nr:hydroxyethylthiazole kinase [Actinocatenispora thailandica]BCJ35670.1 hydroxyethylthiazole kinase [Actinocatenispora thailandica]
MSRTPVSLLAAGRAALAAVRSSTPLVQCITNSVAVNTTANALLALGAAPAMVDLPEEAGGFAAAASGLLVNLGTPGAEHRAAMRAAVAGATAAGTPWVLDPVAVGSLPVRTELAAVLSDAGPDVVRGNASEVLAVAGAGAGGRGVDATDDAEAAADVAAELAVRTGAVVAVSGPVDVITDGRDTVRVRNGHVHLTRMTGGGCALGAVIAAFAATGPDRLASTVAAVLTYTVAAELAAERAAGPGSFAPAFLDALSVVDGAVLDARASLA